MLVNSVECEMMDVSLIRDKHGFSAVGGENFDRVQSIWRMRNWDHCASAPLRFTRTALQSLWRLAVSTF